MEHPSAYNNRRVVVLGLARSGVSVAKVFHTFGADVLVNDMKPRDQSPEAEELEKLGIPVICGHHPKELITEQTALLVKNPGIPYTAPPVARALALQVPVITEVEVAYWLSAAPLIGITGSNGKTTTTTWIGKLLEAAGLSVLVAGNIGRPLCEAALEARADQWIVAELSSFQLKGTVQFRPRIGLLLNVTETHLDYHGDMNDYVQSKARLFRHMTAEDTAVLNWDDPVCRALAGEVAARLLPFSLYTRLPSGVYVDPPYPEEEAKDGGPLLEGTAQATAVPEDAERAVTAAEVEDAARTVTAAEVEDAAQAAALPEETRWLVWRTDGGTSQRLLPVSRLGIPGKHNAANALAAIAASLAAGADPARLIAPLEGFHGVEHRLEYIGVYNGVAYFNDSKATNPTATMMSVRSLTGGIVLIAGGLDRGSDYRELLPLFRDRLKGLVVYGQTRDKLAAIAAAAGLLSVRIVEPREEAEAELRAAVQAAASLAQAGDKVLLSPACASWDMFPSYEVRGRMFKDSVHTL